MAINWPADCVTLRDKAELMCIAKRRCIEEHNAAGLLERTAWVLRLRVVTGLIRAAICKYGDVYADMPSNEYDVVKSWLVNKESSTRWSIATSKLEQIDYLADRGLVAQLQES